VYREYYSRRRDGDWDIAKYTYEYLDLSRTKRLAYHLHNLGTRRRVPRGCERIAELASGRGAGESGSDRPGGLPGVSGVVGWRRPRRGLEGHWSNQRDDPRAPPEGPSAVMLRSRRSFGWARLPGRHAGPPPA
jgi:hypothetical protein